MIFVSFTFYIYKKIFFKDDANSRPHMVWIRRHLLIESDTRQIYRLLWSRPALSTLISK